MSSSIGNSPFLQPQETREFPTHQLLPPLVLLQVRCKGGWFPWGYPKSLLLHLLEAPWQQRLSSSTGEDSHLDFGDGKTLVSKWALTGPVQAAVIDDSCCQPAAPGLPCSWSSPACPSHQPLDIPAGGPDCYEGGREGGDSWVKQEGAFRLFVVSFSSVCFTLSPFTPLSAPMPALLAI